MEKVRRRNYLVNPGLQLKHAGFDLIVALLASFVFGFVIYKSDIIAAISEISRTCPEEMPGFMTKLVLKQSLLTVSLLVPVVLIGSIYLSHGIAGPVHGLEKRLRGIADGKFGLRLRIRKRDELQGLVNETNRVLGSIRDVIARTEEAVSSVREDLVRTIGIVEHVCADIEHVRTHLAARPDKREDMSELREHIEHLDNHIRKVLSEMKSRDVLLSYASGLMELQFGSVSCENNRERLDRKNPM
jgi:methyl-accepting chemotaxis protein